MEQSNQATSRRFILLGLSTVPQLQVVFFVIFFVKYLLTILGNLLLIVAVRISPTLHSSMYFFLTNLSIIDICFTSSIVPVILMNTISKDTSISLLGCVAQMYISLTLGGTECIILAFMAYDRFATICRPLHYNTKMSKTLCFSLAGLSWSVGIVNSIVQVTLIFQLSFCKCEGPSLIRMSCGDTLLSDLVMFITGGIMVLCSFLLTLISYVHIIFSILKIHSTVGRQKAFSTCTSHLTVVTLYYGPIIFMYLQPHSNKHTHYSVNSDKVISILYTTVTPMLNPLKYSMRNKEVKNTLTAEEQGEVKIANAGALPKVDLNESMIADKGPSPELENKHMLSKRFCSE
ncbi:olfactory receptor 2G6-like [Dendrobates tinctorius]|uniref:olfactory receptor 2G6-like n=1 Tax=Dendrobates tinctorius TaxID=92724 RepID=UPI003CC93809